MVVRKRPKYGRSVTSIKIVTRSGVSHGSLTRGCVIGLRTRYLSSHGLSTSTSACQWPHRTWLVVKHRPRLAPSSSAAALLKNLERSEEHLQLGQGTSGGG